MTDAGAQGRLEGGTQEAPLTGHADTGLRHHQAGRGPGRPREATGDFRTLALNPPDTGTSLEALKGEIMLCPSLQPQTLISNHPRLRRP